MCLTFRGSSFPPSSQLASKKQDELTAHPQICPEPTSTPKHTVTEETGCSPSGPGGGDTAVQEHCEPTTCLPHGGLRTRHRTNTPARVKCQVRRTRSTGCFCAVTSARRRKGSGQGAPQCAVRGLSSEKPAEMALSTGQECRRVPPTPDGLGGRWGSALPTRQVPRLLREETGTTGGGMNETSAAWAMPPAAYSSAPSPGSCSATSHSTFLATHSWSILEACLASCPPPPSPALSSPSLLTAPPPVFPAAPDTSSAWCLPDCRRVPALCGSRADHHPSPHCKRIC